MVTCSKCKLNYDERRGACPRCGAPLPDGVVVQPKKPPIKSTQTSESSTNTQNRPVEKVVKPTKTVNNTVNTVQNPAKVKRKKTKEVEYTPENMKKATGFSSRVIGLLIVVFIIGGSIIGCISFKGKVEALFGKDTSKQESSEEELPYNPMQEEKEPEVDDLLSDNITEAIPDKDTETVLPSEDLVPPTDPIEPTDTTEPTESKNPIEPSETLDVVGLNGEKNPVGCLKNPHPVGDTEPYGGTDITVAKVIVQDFEGTVVVPPSTTATRFGVMYINVVNNLEDPIASKEVGIRFADQDTGVWLSDDYILKYEGEDSELVQYEKHGSWEINGGEEGTIAIPFDPSILSATNVVAITLDGNTAYYTITVQE